MLGRSHPAKPERVKLILIGPSGSGKSALLRRMKKGRFLLKHEPTMIIDRAMVKSHAASTEWQVLDTVGGDRFRRIVRSYYGESTQLALFTLDGSEFEDEAFQSQKDYLRAENKLILKLVPHAVRILVVTKSDLTSPPQRCAEIDYFAAELGISLIRRVSAVTLAGIVQLEDLLLAQSHILLHGEQPVAKLPLKKLSTFFRPPLEKSAEMMGKPSVGEDSMMMVLVGPSGAGKTALHSKLTEGEYKFSNEYQKTVMPYYGVADYADEPQLKIWDQPGIGCVHPLFGMSHALLGMSYEKADIIVYVLNGDSAWSLKRQKEALLSEKRQIDYMRSRYAISILVVTQYDLLDPTAEPRIKRFSLKEMDILPENLFFVSAKTGFGVETLKTHLQAQADSIFYRGSGPRNRIETQLLVEEEAKNEGDVERFFREAQQKLIPDSTVLTMEATRAAGGQFAARLEASMRQTLADLRSDRITLTEASRIAVSARTLAHYVATLDADLEDRIVEFRQEVAPCLQTSRLSMVIFGLIGAAFGIVAGVMLSAGVVGPAAIFAAVKGAKLGMSVGAAVGASAGVWFSMWSEKRDHHLTKLEEAAWTVWRRL